MPRMSNPPADLPANRNKLLLALLAVVAAALFAGSSGGLRFGGEEDEGTGFGGTGRAPIGGSGLGGTGFKPWLGDTGEVEIRYRPDAVVIAEQVAEADIPRMPAPEAVQPPPAIVSGPQFAAAHPAEVSITDSIQGQLQRDAVIYQRIVESVEGYYPPEVERSAARVAPPVQAPVQAPVQVPQPASPANPETVTAAEETVEPPEPAAASWAELVAYLAENQPAKAEPAIESVEVTAEPATVQRPNRIRRPDLPQVQRGRFVQRPAILPPRVQPMRF